MTFCYAIFHFQTAQFGYFLIALTLGLFGLYLGISAKWLGNWANGTIGVVLCLGFSLFDGLQIGHAAYCQKIAINAAVSHQIVKAQQVKALCSSDGNIDIQVSKDYTNASVIFGVLCTQAVAGDHVLLSLQEAKTAQAWLDSHNTAETAFGGSPSMIIAHKD